MSRRYLLSIVFIALFLGAAISSWATRSADLPIEDVFSGAFENGSVLATFMRAHAGERTFGQGALEATMPRSYFDTSVPDSNPAVALIQLGSGQKVACGLPRPLRREEFGNVFEGLPICFSGDLVDAQDWGEWRTVYLGNCDLQLQTSGDENPDSGKHP